jgi:hypothetical protein
MKKLFTSSALSALLFLACQESPVQQPAAEPAAASGQRMLSEIQVGEGSITFYANGKYLSFLEKRKPGTPSIIGKEMEGLSFAEIHKRLAPDMQVPVELSDDKDRYQEISAQDIDPDGVRPLAEGNHLESEIQVPLAKAADLNDTWFRDNYCNPLFAQYSGYKACLLNRAGPGTDWAWANATRSRVYVYPHTGTYIHLNGKVDGSGVFDADLLTGWVYNYYMFSAARWYSFGCRTTLQHYYTITHTSGQFWHWAFGSHTDC